MMMSKHSASRKQKAESVWFRRAVQTCFALAFSIWVLNQLKLLLLKGNTRTADVISYGVVEDRRNHTPNEQLRLTRKSLFRVKTEVVSLGNVKDGGEVMREVSKVEDAQEANEERQDEWMDSLEEQFDEKAANGTIDRVRRAENVEESWELFTVNGSDDFESFDSSVSAVDQDQKEDNVEQDFLDEAARIEEANQEDANQDEANQEDAADQ